MAAHFTGSGACAPLRAGATEAFAPDGAQFPGVHRPYSEAARAASRIGRMAHYQFSVSVIPQYLPEQSDPDQGVYAYSYTVTVINTGRIAAQLIARHWIITDATGKVDEVRGLGVVGQQPLLQPGEAFEYTSWSQLPTPTGSMRGSYFCVAEDGNRFDATIPEFALVQPRSLH